MFTLNFDFSRFDFFQAQCISIFKRKVNSTIEQQNCKGHKKLTFFEKEVLIFSFSLRSLLFSNCQLTILKTIFSFDKSRSASNLSIILNNIVCNPGIVCKYFGVLIDTKLSFHNHIQKVKTKIGRHCGVISKMRRFVP